MIADIIPTTQVSFDNPMAFARLAMYGVLAYATRKNKMTYVFITAAGVSLATSLMMQFAKITVDAVLTNKGV